MFKLRERNERRERKDVDVIGNKKDDYGVVERKLRQNSLRGEKF